MVNDPHLKEREFFVQTDHPVAGEVSFPGAPFNMSLTPWQLKNPAPILGQHNQEVYSGILGHSPEEIDCWHEQGVV